MLRSTIIFLVLLRLAIGWHFMFEGLNKLRSVGTSKPFSSEIYFREAEGPLGDFFRTRIGDPDQLALTRLTPVEGAEKATEKIADYLPPIIQAEWKAYFDAFRATFALNPAQDEVSQAKFDQAREGYMTWLLKGTKAVDRDFPNSKVEVTLTTPQRIAEYRQKILTVRELVDSKNYLLGKNVEKTAIPAAKADIVKARTALQSDMDDQFAKLKKSLADVLKLDMPDPMFKPDAANPDQSLLQVLTLIPSKDGSVSADQLAGPLADHWAAYASELKARFAFKDSQKEEIDRKLQQAKLQLVRNLQNLHPYSGTPLLEKTLGNKITAYQKLVAANANATPELLKLRGELQTEIDTATKIYLDALDEELTPALTEAQVKAVVKSIFLEWNDVLVMWSLTIMGACLLIGFASRIAAFGCAGFLFLTYLAVPAFPWLPSPPNSEGNYVFINKNTVEMLALMVLVTVPSGRWLGIDGLIVHCWNRTFPKSGSKPTTETAKRTTAKPVKKV